MVPVLLQPKSRGRISLKSANPFHWPRMEPNFMQHPDDIQAMIEGIQIVSIIFFISLESLEEILTIADIEYNTNQSHEKT